MLLYIFSVTGDSISPTSQFRALVMLLLTVGNYNVDVWVRSGGVLWTPRLVRVDRVVQ